MTNLASVVFFDIGNTLVVGGEWAPGARDILAALRSPDIRIGLISNTGNLSRDDLRELLPDDFDFDDFEPELVLLSSETGLEKPDLRAFREAVRLTDEPASSCLFVGENLNETLAAQAVGMQAVRIGTDTAADFDLLRQQLA